MITGQLKNQIDSIWNDMHSYGITNPLVTIEQLTYLFFIKSLDDVETANEKKDAMLGIQSERIFSQDTEGQKLRWSKFSKLRAEEIFSTIQHKVFPFIRKLKSDKKSAYARYMKDATFSLPNALITQKVVTAITDLPLNDRDLKGDLYEYMISKLQTAGRNGQFRTPRHIIRMMVELTKPTIKDTIIDPACGTGGFLINAGQYVRDNNEKTLRLDPKAWRHFQNEMFTGYDTDQTMLRISAMNTILHGMDDADIRFNDSLSASNQDSGQYSLVLANPPFKGSLDYAAVSPSLINLVKTKKTELLFVALFLRILEPGGRCACIVPDGVLFGSSNAHKALRKELVENHQVTAVISMPSGVFMPYAGVSTAILIFTKSGTGGTKDVWFYDMKADGFSLDAKRSEIADNDIPDIITRFNNLEQEKNRKRTDHSFFVPKQEIVDNDYDLSINKYKKIEYTPVEYPPTSEILKELGALQAEIAEELAELEKML